MSLLGICFLNERVLFLEIVGMVVCFGGVIMVTLAPKDQQ
jgi:drug/metabolite transporter (DMT)-like permease